MNYPEHEPDEQIERLMDKADYLRTERKDREYEEEWAKSQSPDNRPQDGRICDCEDAPCCGHYDL
jgi:hypothetical protein